MPVRELTRETLGVLDGLRGKGVRAIQGPQALPPEDPETVSQVVLFKALKDLNKDGVAMARGDRLEAGAEVIVARNLRDATQGMGVMAALVFLEPALVRQKRGRLSHEDANGASGSIWHTVWCIAACTTVGPWIDPLSEYGPEINARGTGLGYVPCRYRYSAWASALEAELEDAFVVRERRRRGVGVRLVAFAIARATARGCRSLGLNTNARNDHAVALYRRLGFVAERARWQGGRQLWLQKSLVPS